MLNILIGPLALPWIIFFSYFIIIFFNFFNTASGYGIKEIFTLVSAPDKLCGLG